MDDRGGADNLFIILLIIILMFWVANGFRDGRSATGQVSGSTVTRQVPASGNLTPVPEGQP